MPFSKEPPYSHGTAARTAVLLCNLGTPDAPPPVQYAVIWLNS